MGKLSLGLGLGVGYVLGTQAGRARYEQIKQAASALLGRPEVQQAVESARTAAPAPLRPVIDKLASAGSGAAPSADSGSGGSSPSQANRPDPLVPPAKSPGS